MIQHQQRSHEGFMGKFLSIVMSMGFAEGRLAYMQGINTHNLAAGGLEAASV
jgi:hypothetical protein